MKIIYGIQNVMINIFRVLGECILSLGKVLYNLLYIVEWKFPKGKRPLSFDHNIELMFLWNKGEIDWLERGMYNLFCIHQFEKPQIIELGCADGFYAYRFYSVIPNSYVTACDKDKKNIERALISL